MERKDSNVRKVTTGGDYVVKLGAFFDMNLSHIYPPVPTIKHDLSIVKGPVLSFSYICCIYISYIYIDIRTCTCDLYIYVCKSVVLFLAKKSERRRSSVATMLDLDLMVYPMNIRNWTMMERRLVF